MRIRKLTEYKPPSCFVLYCFVCEVSSLVRGIAVEQESGSAFSFFFDFCHDGRRSGIVSWTNCLLPFLDFGQSASSQEQKGNLDTGLTLIYIGHLSQEQCGHSVHPQATGRPFSQAVCGAASSRWEQAPSGCSSGWLKFASILQLLLSSVYPANLPSQPGSLLPT